MPSIDAYAQRLELAKRAWTCRGSCGLSFVGLAVPGDELCPECRERSAAALAPPPKELLLEAQLAAAGVPWRFRQGWTRASWTAAFGAWPTAALAAWRPRSASSLLLVIGPTSCGKTGLATLLLAEAIAAGASGWWQRSQGLLDQVRLAGDAERVGHGSATAYRIAAVEAEQRCTRADVLVLDDFLAAETHTPPELKRLQGLAAQRYDDGQATVITTNRTPKQLKHLLPSLRSRLLSGVQILLETPGGERRNA